MVWRRSWTGDRRHDGSWRRSEDPEGAVDDAAIGNVALAVAACPEAHPAWPPAAVCADAVNQRHGDRACLASVAVSSASGVLPAGHRLHRRIRRWFRLDVSHGPCVGLSWTVLPPVLALQRYYLGMHGIAADE